MENQTNQNQQPQSVDVVGIVAKAMYQCQADITRILDLMFQQNGKLIEELKKTNEIVIAKTKEIEELKEKLKGKK